MPLLLQKLPLSEQRPADRGLFSTDIGKTKELSKFPGNDYTEEGQFANIIGVQMIDEKLREIPGFPVLLANEVRHCILAHHGELEYGSPKKPAIAEALALNFADNTDAKLEIRRRWHGPERSMDRIPEPF